MLLLLADSHLMVDWVRSRLFQERFIIHKHTWIVLWNWSHSREIWSCFNLIWYWLQFQCAKTHKTCGNIRKPNQENPMQIKTYNWESPVCVNLLLFASIFSSWVKQLHIEEKKGEVFVPPKKIVWLVVLISGYLYQRLKIVFLVAIHLQLQRSVQFLWDMHM